MALNPVQDLTCWHLLRFDNPNDPWRDEVNNHTRPLGGHANQYLHVNGGSRKVMLNNQVYCIDLTQEWFVSIEARITGDTAGDWNVIFGFNTHINYSGAYRVTCPLGINGNCATTIDAAEAAYRAGKWHRYHMHYNPTDGYVTTSMDGVRHSVVALSSVTDNGTNPLGFFIGGGGGYACLSLDIKQFTLIGHKSSSTPLEVISDYDFTSKTPYVNKGSINGTLHESSWTNTQLVTVPESTTKVNPYVAKVDDCPVADYCLVCPPGDEGFLDLGLFHGDYDNFTIAFWAKFEDGANTTKTSASVWNKFISFHWGQYSRMNLGSQNLSSVNHSILFWYRRGESVDAISRSSPKDDNEYYGWHFYQIHYNNHKDNWIVFKDGYVMWEASTMLTHPIFFYSTSDNTTANQYREAWFCISLASGPMTATSISYPHDTMYISNLSITSQPLAENNDYFTWIRTRSKKNYHRVDFNYLNESGVMFRKITDNRKADKSLGLNSGNKDISKTFATNPIVATTGTDNIYCDSPQTNMSSGIGLPFNYIGENWLNYTADSWYYAPPSMSSNLNTWTFSCWIKLKDNFLDDKYYVNTALPGTHNDNDFIGGLGFILLGWTDGHVQSENLNAGTVTETSEIDQVIYLYTYQSKDVKYIIPVYERQTWNFASEKYGNSSYVYKSNAVNLLDFMNTGASLLDTYGQPKWTHILIMRRKQHNYLYINGTAIYARSTVHGYGFAPWVQMLQCAETYLNDLFLIDDAFLTLSAPFPGTEKTVSLPCYISKSWSRYENYITPQEAKAATGLVNVNSDAFQSTVHSKLDSHIASALVINASGVTDMNLNNTWTMNDPVSIVVNDRGSNWNSHCIKFDTSVKAENGLVLSSPDSKYNALMWNTDWTISFWNKRTTEVTEYGDYLVYFPDDEDNASIQNCNVRCGLKYGVTFRHDSYDLEQNPARNDSNIAPMELNVWNHIAIVNYNQIIKLYINGRLHDQYDMTQFKNTIVIPGQNFNLDGMKIGYNKGIGINYAGYIDDFVIIRNGALWTSEFTPPTRAFTIIDKFGIPKFNFHGLYIS